jgi:hypothetical protein
MSYNFFKNIFEKLTKNLSIEYIHAEENLNRTRAILFQG